MRDSEPLSAPRETLPLLRILDANLNRASEGLRVVEEYTRFVLNDDGLTANCKKLRHELTTICRKAFSPCDLLTARDTVADVGTQLQTATEYHRASLLDVVTANLKRIEQSLRALEEYGKIVSPNAAMAIEQLRYQTYTLAKAVDGGSERAEVLAAARLYVLINGAGSPPRFAALAEALIDGGVDAIQLRDKQLADRELLDRARQLRAITRGRCLFIMNDRPDLAALADADGVHVGQDELSVRDARSLLGPKRLVGVSTHTTQQARQAVADGADYIGCGPTFPSGTKSFTEFPGVAFLSEVATEIKLPAFAIGGISLANVEQVVAAGIDRVAVSGAIVQAADPRTAVSEFLAKLGVIRSK